MDKEGVILLALVLFSVISLPDIANFGVVNLPIDFEGHPEYMSEMLTALSILFGFWEVLVETTPEKRIRNLKEK